MGESKLVDDAWRRHIAPKGIYEWPQDLLTCETGITISRIDRIYSSLHTVHQQMDEISCNALDRRPDLSAHRPISFQLRSLDAQPNLFNRFPAWIINHESFGEEVFAEYQYSMREESVDPFMHLQLFKEAVLKSSRYIRVKAKRREPTTTDE